MFRTFAWLCAFGAAMFAGAADAQTLSLRQAMENTLASAPELRGAEARIRAAEAGEIQAGAHPNPSLGFEVENFLGTGAMQGFADTEVTATYSQIWERGGKRDARLLAARRETDVTGIAREVAALDLMARVETLYYEALRAEVAIGLAEERLGVARALASEVQRRVNAARDPLFAGTRAEANVAAAEVELAAAVRARDDALAALTALWGAPPDGIRVSGEEFFMLDARFPAGEVMSPDVALAEAAAARASAEIDVEVARGIVDPTLHGGVRYLAGADAAALVAGVSIPLPLYNTNEGAVQRASALREAAREEAEAVRLQRLRDIAALQRDIRSAQLKADAIAEGILPLAARAAEEARDGFTRGGFTFRDVQDADEGLVEARSDWLDALAEIHRLQVTLNRVTGSHLPLISEEVR